MYQRIKYKLSMKMTFCQMAHFHYFDFHFHYFIIKKKNVNEIMNNENVFHSIHFFAHFGKFSPKSFITAFFVHN